MPAARGENQFVYPLTYLIIAAMLATILMQLHWLSIALMWFDAVYVIPVFQVSGARMCLFRRGLDVQHLSVRVSVCQCFFITITIVGGAVYFKELAAFSLLQFVMFPIGVAFILGGIVLLR